MIIDLKIDHLRPSEHWKGRHERLSSMKRAIDDNVETEKSHAFDNDVKLDVSRKPLTLDEWRFRSVDGSSEVKQKSSTMDLELYKAAREGDVDKFIDALERFSAEKNQSLPTIFKQLSPLGNTFLHVSASYGHEDLAGFIVHHFRRLITKPNHKGDFPLHLAAAAGHLGVVSILVKFKYRNEHETTAGNTRTPNGKGNTPLHEAMMNGRDKVADYLVEFDKEVAYRYVNKEGKSPLYLAVEDGSTETVKSMLISSLKENSPGDIRGNGKSPIHAAILGRNHAVMQEIVNFDPTLIHSKDENGQNPLHFAASVGFLDEVRLLINKYSINLFERDNNGLCPIHVASRNGHVEVIEELLRHFSDVKEFVNQEGQNILHVAAKNGNDKVVKYILKTPKLELLINEGDEDGNTPLHLAALNWHPKVVSSLTWDDRVRVKLLNNDGLTALEAAEEYMETMAPYRKRLTWMALMSAGVPRGINRKKAKLNKQKSKTDEPYNNIDYSKDRVNTLLLMSALIATVTFAAWFTAPGGNNESAPDQGMATMVSNKMFQIFVVCDTMAMYTSMLVAVILIWAQLGDLNLVFNALRLAIPLLGASLSMMSLAFMVSVHLVVSKVAWLANFVLIVGAVSVSCLLAVFVPLYLPYTSKFRIFRHICYYPFCLLMLSSGSYDDDGAQIEE